METEMLTREDVKALMEEQVQSAVKDAVETAVEAAVQTLLSRKEEALLNQEQALNAREKEQKALALLREKALPEEMAPALAAMDEEEMLSAVNAWEELFRRHVMQAVEEKLRGESPETGVMQDMSNLSDQDYYASCYPHLV